MSEAVLNYCHELLNHIDNCSLVNAGCLCYLCCYLCLCHTINVITLYDSDFQNAKLIKITEYFIMKPAQCTNEQVQ